jgi:hypothetical protein
MIQYLAGEMTTIVNKDGDIRKIRMNRKRIKYDPKTVLVYNLQDTEVMRVDLLAQRLGTAFLKIGDIIDVNDVDVFSMVAMNTVYFHSDRANF